MHSKYKGFTLIEIMIVVAILGIVAAIAIPSYQRVTLTSNRTDAKTAINLIANEQARFFAINRSYTTDMTTFSLNDNGTESISASGHFKLSVAAGATGNIASSYEITATPNTDFQAKDECKEYTLDSAGVKTADPSVAVCWE